MSFMFARLNFLFAVSALTLLLFYLSGRFVFLEAILAVAPSGAPYFSAAYALVALMLSVLVLAKTVIRLGRVSAIARHRGADFRSFIAQLTLLLAHLCAGFAVYTLFTEADGSGPWWPWILAALLYPGGIGIAVSEWRKRALQPSS